MSYLKLILENDNESKLFFKYKLNDDRDIIKIFKLSKILSKFTNSLEFIEEDIEKGDEKKDEPKINEKKDEPKINEKKDEPKINKKKIEINDDFYVVNKN